MNNNQNCEKSNINQITDFIKEIGLTLLKNYEKVNPIKFIIEKSISSIKLIKTDVIQLKQILVNLLSNSIKHNKSGKINIRVQNNLYEKNNIDIIFSDSRISNKIERYSNLFQLSKSIKKENLLTSELGLFIVSEKSNLLNSPMKIFSGLEQGSDFILTIIDIETLKMSINEVIISKHNFNKSYLNKFNSNFLFLNEQLIRNSNFSHNEEEIRENFDDKFKQKENFKNLKINDDSYFLNDNNSNLNFDINREFSFSAETIITKNNNLFLGYEDKKLLFSNKIFTEENIKQIPTKVKNDNPKI